MKYVLIILLFASCNATKQAAKHLNKAFKKDRVYVAKVTRDSFPCTDLFRTDTAVYVYDSLIYIDCPDYHIGDTNEMVHDTLYQISRLKFQPSNKTIKVPVYLPIKTITVNHFFEDSTKILIAQKEASTAQREVEKYKGKSQRRGSLIAWLIASIAILIATIVLLIRSKLK